MVDPEGNILTFHLKYVLSFLALYTIFHFWKKRYFYYYASKIPGPFCLPIVGCVPLLLTKDLFSAILKVVSSYPSISRIWLGPKLIISSSKPEHVEIVLNKFLEKGYIYKYFMEIARTSIISVSVDIWKEKRKIYNKSLRQNILNPYQDIFAKNSYHMIEVLDQLCGKDVTNITPKLWDCVIVTGIETLADLDPSIIKGLAASRPSMEKLEETMITRIHKFWLTIDVFWKMSALHKDVVAVQAILDDIADQYIDYKKNTLKKESRDTNKLDFFNNLMYLHQDGLLSIEDIKEETRIMMGAATKTISTTLSFIFIVLGIYLDIQEKVYQEVTSVIGERKEVTLEDSNQLKYTDRVIKETMRLFPAIPMITRLIDRDLTLDSCVIPEGSEFFIPIFNIHRDSRLWPNPLKFDPDRFLPEEVKKRHRCAYIPFSFGSRDCVGYRYAQMYLQCILPSIIRNFKIKTLNYSSSDQIECQTKIFLKPEGYILKIERRNEVLL